MLVQLDVWVIGYCVEMIMHLVKLGLVAAPPAQGVAWFKLDGVFDCVCPVSSYGKHGAVRSKWRKYHAAEEDPRKKTYSAYEVASHVEKHDKAEVRRQLVNAWNGRSNPHCALLFSSLAMIDLVNSNSTSKLTKRNERRVHFV